MTALYLDACSIVPLFAPEPSSTALVSLIATNNDLVVSDFGAGEVASAISRKVREQTLSTDQGRVALASLDEWIDIAVRLVETTSADMRRATALVRRFELKLRLPDALHLAACERVGAQLVTRDQLMADAADALGMPLMRLL